MPPAPRGFEHVFRFYSTDGELLAKILPGEYYVTSPPEGVTTLLGSCVAACIRDPIAGVGGMNHFLLPDSNFPAMGLASDANRYGAWAMESLINTILKGGGNRSRLELKIFGGANMGSSRQTIGAQNIAFVEEYAAREGLRVEARSVGGNSARKVVYNPGSGRVRVLKLPPIQQRALELEERELQQKVDRAIHEMGPVELFD
jgi:chemotaxis protein CheD